MSPRPIDSEELLQHADWVRDLARRMIGDQHAAEDVAQDALVTALSQPPQTRANLRGWFSSVLCNLVRARARRDRRRAAREEQWERPPQENSPQELVDRLTQHRVVVDEVQELPEPVRQTILLRFFERRSLREIAATTDVPVSTVNTRIRRGLSLLRERFDRRYGDRCAWIAAMLPLVGGRSATVGGAGGLWSVLSIVAAIVALAVAAALWWPDATELPSVDRAASQVDPGSAAAPVVAQPLLRVAIERRATPPSAASRLASISGQVIDARGANCPDVEVSFFAAVSEDRYPTLRVRQGSAGQQRQRASAPALVTALTDQSGGFAMDVPQVDGRLRVSSGGWTTALAGVSWSDLDDERVVVVARTRSLSGLVRDECGDPIEGATLSWELPEDFRARFDRALDRSVIDLYAVDSDAAGRFDLAVPDIHGATLVARHDGFCERRLALDDAGDRLDVELVAAGAVQPTVVVVRFVDENERPVVGVKATLDGSRIFQVDSHGCLELGAADLTPATELVALRAGYQSVRVAVARLRSGSEITVAIATPAYSISGCVVDRDGKPIAGAYAWLRDPTVFAYSANEVVVVESELAGVSSSWNVAVTNRAGRFRIDGLEPRQYDIRVARPNTCLFGEARSVQAGDLNALIHYPTEEVVAAVRGRVTDHIGQPLAGILVGGSRGALQLDLEDGSHATWFANGPQTRTAADGTFVLRDVPCGIDLATSGQNIYMKRFAASQWQHKESTLVVSHRCHLQITTRTPSASLAFEVLDAAGRPVQVRMLLGIASLPQKRWPLSKKQSAVLVIPDHARTVVLFDADKEVERRPITPTATGVTRVAF